MTQIRALEEASGERDAAAAHEATAARHQLRHGRAVTGARARPSPADRQRGHRAAQAAIPALLAMAREHGAGRHARAAHRERLRLWPLQLTTSPNQRTLYNFPDATAAAAMMLRLGGMRLCEAGIVPIDSCTTASCSRIPTPRRVEHASEIMPPPAAMCAADSTLASTWAWKCSSVESATRQAARSAEDVGDDPGHAQAIGALARRATA